MSYGQDMLAAYLRNMVEEKPIQNYRPDWLLGMELDFYFPTSKVALEFNGDQNLIPTNLKADPMPQIRRDCKKRAICVQRGIKFKSLEAIDLEYTRLAGVFRKLKLPKLEAHLPALKNLNIRCKEYRKGLILKYNSPTARRRSFAPRNVILKVKCPLWKK